MLLDLDAIAPLARGCAVLGTGGGGDTAAVELMLRRAIELHGPVALVSADELADGLVMPCGGIGSPVVSFEKLDGGDEGTRLRAEVERAFDGAVVALMASEIGGSNGLMPIAWAAQTGLPVLDADGMGRAFPEVQMVTMELAGIATSPAVLVDERGNVAVLRATDGRMLERLERAVCVEMGGAASGADYVMTTAQVASAVIHGSVSRALRIGRVLADAGDPLEALTTELGAVPLIAGKLTDVERRGGDGFARGAATIEGTGSDAGRTVTIEIQNENLVAREGDRVLASVPDLITLLDAETAHAVATERLRYGRRVVAVGIPCAAIWRTERGLAVAGPHAFGYDLDFVPVERARA